MAYYGVRKDKTGCRDAVGEELHNEMLKLLDISDDHLHHEGVAAGNVIAFADSFEGFDELGELAVLFPVADHPNVCLDSITESGGVDLETITTNDAGILETTDAFRRS